ncbi:hypothetical protein L596_006030 [Steinernema carpocapsae]|uniref:Uncharacterized protein n=1 Tax=Steinernema carpocapsae TaxID=34508 RepID=A0A4U8V0W5_STECR|nr:hypothetical protein L596_006030 [Steinernema carpocapsae]
MFTGSRSGKRTHWSRVALRNYGTTILPVFSALCRGAHQSNFNQATLWKMQRERHYGLSGKRRGQIKKG